jgi:GLPGLI family protein
MKINFNLFLVFIFSSFYGQDLENNIKVSYGFLNNSSNIVNDKKYQEIAKKTYKDAYKIAEDILSFELIYKNKESIFFKNKFISDESYSSLVQITLQVIENNKFYRNDKNNEFFYTFKFFENSNLIKINDFVKPEITAESKVINNYLCYKAVCYDEVSKQNVTVWFAPELNFNIGPLNFHNFPGLVLEVNFEYYSIVCKKIDFNPSDEDLAKIIKPKGELISEDDLLKTLEKTKSKLKKN